MIIALLLAAAPVHAQLISPGLGRVVSALVAIPSHPQLLAHSNAVLMTPPLSLSLAPTAVPLPIVAVSAAASEGPAPLSPLSALSRTARTENGDRYPSLNYFWDGLAFGQVYEVPATPVPLSFDPQSALSESARPVPWLSVRDPSLARALDAAVEWSRHGPGALHLQRRPGGRRDPGRGPGRGGPQPSKNYGEPTTSTAACACTAPCSSPAARARWPALWSTNSFMSFSTRRPAFYALELELEAHLQDLEMLAELGLTPPPDTFARQAMDALATSPAFVELIQAAAWQPLSGEDLSTKSSTSWAGLKSARLWPPRSATLPGPSQPTWIT